MIAPSLDENQSYRSVKWLSASQSGTLVAGNMGVTTMGWWAATQGGVIDLSLMTSSYLLFSLLLGPILSPLGDRYSRINVYGIALFFGWVYYGTWACGLFGFGYGKPLIVGLAFVNACTMSIVGPIRMAIFVDAKGSYDPKGVMAFQRLTDNVGRCLGPILAGLLCATFGYKYAYFFQLFFFCVAFIFYLRARNGFSQMPTTSSSKGRGIHGWLSDISFGFHLRLSTVGQRIVTALGFFYLAVVSSFIAILLPQVIVMGGYPSTLLGISTSASFVGGLLTGTALLSSRFPAGRFVTPVSILLSCVGIISLVFFPGKIQIPLASFLIGSCTEIYFQRIGFRMILSFHTQQRARLTASGQFINTASIALWCWALVPLYHYYGVRGVVCILVGSSAISFALILHPEVMAFLRCPDEALDGFWLKSNKVVSPILEEAP